MCSSTTKVLYIRQYAKHWVVHISVYTTAKDCKARWYSEKIHTNIAEINTFGHYHTIVPRLPKSEWINWRKPVSVVNSQVIMAGTSSRLHFRNGSPIRERVAGGHCCTSKVAGEASANRIKKKPVVLNNSWATDYQLGNVALFFKVLNTIFLFL